MKNFKSKFETFVLNNPDKWEKFETILVVIVLLWAFFVGVPMSLLKVM